ncbi:hypothetical protein [Enterococcus sp. DIV1420a]|uniref:hypothetical protein n=1 Tax=Enterococcus sp. DIV1420a TaxID=2774672 RepID=UPI003F26953F
MKLSQKNLKKIYLKEVLFTQNSTGKEMTIYSDKPTEIEMNIQPATGTVLAQIYGNKLNTVKSCKYQGNKINEGEHELWGVCLNVSKNEQPDYKIVAITTFSSHKNILIERL